MGTSTFAPGDTLDAPPADLSFKVAATNIEAPGSVKVEGDQGVVTALVSVTGIADNVNDIIEPGAYAETLKKRNPKVCWNHSWEQPIGRVTDIVELHPGDPRLPKQTKDGKPWPKAAGGLLATMQINLKSDRGREAFEAIKFFSASAECEWSIGYTVTKSLRDKANVRHIKSLELYEASFVLFGAAPLSMSVSVKDAIAAALEARGPAASYDPALEAKYDDGPLGSASNGENWVEKAGGLPPFVRALVRGIMKSGHSQSQAIAIAIGVVKRWAAGAGKVTEKTRAKAAAAVAQWEAAKAKAHATKSAAHWESVDHPRDNTGKFSEAATAAHAVSTAVTGAAAATDDAPKVNTAFTYTTPGGKTHTRKSKTKTFPHAILMQWDGYKSETPGEPNYGEPGQENVSFASDLKKAEREAETIRRVNKRYVNLRVTIHGTTATPVPSKKSIETADLIDELLDLEDGLDDTNESSIDAGEFDVLADDLVDDDTYDPDLDTSAAPVEGKAIADGYDPSLDFAQDVADTDGLSGSLEERLRAVRMAVRDLYSPRLSRYSPTPEYIPSRWASVLATWDDRVIVTVTSESTSAVSAPTRAVFEVPYTLVDDVAVLGEPVEVRATVTFEGGADTTDATPDDLVTVNATDALDQAAADIKALWGEDVEVKAGRVLSAGNVDRVRQAAENLIAVLRAAGVDISRPDAEDPTAKDAANTDTSTTSTTVRADSMKAAAPIEVKTADVEALLASLRTV